MAKINPFQPNYPVNPGMFVGRLDELNRLERQLLQTRANQPSNFVITGERGIGKSSLLLYLTAVADGRIKVNDASTNFLVIDTDIDRATTQFGLLKKIELAIRKALAKTEKARNFLQEAWDFLKQVEAAGIKIGAKARPLEETTLDEFAYSLADVAQRVSAPDSQGSLFDSSFDGILILVDEADNASEDLQLGSFFKLLMERLQRRGCQRVMLGLAGLPEVRNVLQSSHPSSLRLFEEIRLDRLSAAEVSRVIDIAIDSANRQNPAPTTITDEARSYLVGFAEGYPHFIQQFGFCAFAVDQDGTIDKDDVMKGALGPGGAMELSGDRYYRDNFYKKIQGEGYRQVLRIMADKMDARVTKEDIRTKFKGSLTVLNNALKALRDRHIILAKEGERGVYRLQHKGFALWIKLYTTDPAHLKELATNP